MTQHQASLSFAISQSLLKFMSTELVMPSNHLILSCPPSPAFNLSQHEGLFQCVGSLHQVAEVPGELPTPRPQKVSPGRTITILCPRFVQLGQQGPCLPLFPQNCKHSSLRQSLSSLCEAHIEPCHSPDGQAHSRLQRLLGLLHGIVHIISL